MFKKEINFISDLNLNKLQALGDRFTIEDIKKCKLHPAIFHYIQAVIDKEIFSDRKKIEYNSIFDYNSDRINNYTKLIADEIKRTQLFDSKLIKKIVQDAIVFNTNYLTRPNNTLINLIFGSADVKSIEEIIVGLSHSYYYRYLQKILFTYLEKKQVVLMTKEEFGVLLHRIDSISKETHIEETVTTTVNSIADFFDPNSNSSSQIPIEAIKLYFEEKNLSEFLSKVDYKFGKDSTAIILANDLLSELKSVTPESEISIPESIEIEDELVEDNSELDQAMEDENLLDIEVEEIEIPNNELLSEDDDIEGDSGITEILDPISEEGIENSEKIDDIHKDNSDDIEEERKKKNSSAQVIRKLIDLDSIYNTLLPPLKPFETSSENLTVLEFSQNLSDSIDYSFDPSTISEEFEITQNSTSEIESDKQINAEEIDDNFDYSEVEENIVSDIAENKFIEIKEAVDEVKSADIMENELFREAEIVNTTEISFEDEQDLDGIVSDNEIKIKDEDLEEITEVFTDLAFLDNPDQEVAAKVDLIENNEVFAEDNLEEDYNHVDHSYSQQESINYDTFSAMLSSKDMSKIIEYVFDYDMEDYHSILDQISQSNDESEANKFTEEYCINNHIELSAIEVDTFKSFISEYFSQTYS